MRSPSQEPLRSKWTIQGHRISASRLQALLGDWSDGREPLYVLLGSALAALVGAGLLDDGDQLPSERTLATTLCVARGTVVRAFDELALSGHVERRRGSGTRVLSAGPSGAVRAPGSARFLSGPTRDIDLRIASPDLLPSVRDLIDRPLLTERQHVPGDDDSAGLIALRAAIAHRMTLDGLATKPQEIIVTSGATHGATLLAMHLVQPGRRVIVESTTWPGLTDTIEHLGGRIHRVATHANGIDLGELEQMLHRLEPAFVALNPHHHNPTGARLPIRGRAKLAHLTTTYRVPLVEDRVLARLAFDRVVPPPLAADPTARHYPELHITLDSLDKVAWPGLRVGWVRATPSTIQQLRILRSMTDLQPPVQPQLAALAILEHLDRLVDERTSQLSARVELAIDALSAAMPDATVTRPRGGIALWIRLAHGTGREFTAHAATHGIRIPSGTDFGAPDHDDHIRLAITAPPAELLVGIQRLGNAWATYRASNSARHPHHSVV